MSGSRRGTPAQEPGAFDKQLREAFRAKELSNLLGHRFDELERAVVAFLEETGDDDQTPLDEIDNVIALCVAWKIRKTGANLATVLEDLERDLRKIAQSELIDRKDGIHL